MKKRTVLRDSIGGLLLLLLSGAAPLLTYGNSVVLQAQGDVFPTYPKINYACGLDHKLIDRGEYLAKAGDCLACHTNNKEGGQPFAGGLPFDTPFGTFFSPNITPDKTTGIGNWTDADLSRALHEGLAPNGDNYYPVFPFMYFTRITEDDSKALYAYLSCIPAVEQRNRKNLASFPFNWRFLLSGWKLLFFDFHKGVYQPDPKRPAQWNRGAYLVQGLGHCGMCHTEINMFGAWKTQRDLGGAMVNGFYAPNITSAMLAKYSTADIVKVFDKDEMLDSPPGSVEGPMREVDHDSLRFINEDDLVAIATYLKTVKAVPLKTAKTTGSATDIGKSVYNSNCAVCHTTGAAGAPVLGDAKAWKPRIAQGIPTLDDHALHGFNQMPAKGNCPNCSDTQIKDAVGYIVSQASGAGTAVKVVRTAPPALTTSLAEGKQVYDQSCAMCHMEGKYGAPVMGDKTAWAPRLKQGMDVLFLHTINGNGNMPAKGACIPCNNEQLESAVKYMAQQSSNNNYDLW